MILFIHFTRLTTKLEVEPLILFKEKPGLVLPVNHPPLITAAMHIFDTGARFSALIFSPVFNLHLPADVTSSANLPFPKHQAKYHKELEAAIDAVDRACRLCVDVKISLCSSKEKILEKNDQTPVTIADFGVQALVSLELSKLFPSIPLVAEEDSLFLRENNLVSSVVSEVIAKASDGDNHLSDADVLEAIDRCGKDG